MKALKTWHLRISLSPSVSRLRSVSCSLSLPHSLQEEVGERRVGLQCCQEIGSVVNVGVRCSLQSEIVSNAAPPSADSTINTCEHVLRLGVCLYLYLYLCLCLCLCRLCVLVCVRVSRIPKLLRLFFRRALFFESSTSKETRESTDPTHYCHSIPIWACWIWFGAKLNQSEVRAALFQPASSEWRAFLAMICFLQFKNERKLNPLFEIKGDLVYIYMYKDKHIYIYVYTNIFVYVYMYIYIYTCIYIFIHVYIHTYINIYI